jgi:hypothetical protein
MSQGSYFPPHRNLCLRVDFVSSQVIFSQVMAVTHSMMEMGCSAEQSREFLYRMCVIHQLSEAMRHSLLKHVTAAAETNNRRLSRTFAGGAQRGAANAANVTQGPSMGLSGVGSPNSGRATYGSSDFAETSSNKSPAENSPLVTDYSNTLMPMKVGESSKSSSKSQGSFLQRATSEPQLPSSENAAEAGGEHGGYGALGMDDDALEGPVSPGISVVSV